MILRKNNREIKKEFLTSTKTNEGLYLWSHGPLSIQTFREIQSENLYREVSSYLNGRASQPDGNQRHSNYSPEHFQLSEQLGFTLIRLKGELIGFSTLFKRPCLPGRNARVMNRYYIDPQLRNSREVPLGHSIIMVDQQVRMAQDLGLEYLWISVEQLKPTWFESWIKTINEHSEHFWTYESSKVYFVSDYKYDLRCWQHVAFLTLDSEAPVDQIEEADVMELRSKLTKGYHLSFS